MSERHIQIRKGLDLPIQGAFDGSIEDGLDARQVAVIGPDYVGMKPTMAVAVGDEVALGQLLFDDKKTPGVRYTSPAAGKVVAVNRGEKRALQSVVIEVDGSDREERFELQGGVRDASRDAIRDTLVSSGAWIALRTRPFSRVPAIDSIPRSIFVTAIETRPLAGDPTPVISEYQADFDVGLEALAKLSGGKVFVCRAPNASFTSPSVDGVDNVSFSGPHPAGLPGTHIHHLDPVGAERVVWTIGYQDVIAFGRLLSTGRIWGERVVTIAGPGVETPKRVRTRLGANVDDLTKGLLKDGHQRVVSGSVLCGRLASGPFAFLGRYHTQISVIPEGRERAFLGWLSPGANTHSIKNTFLSRLNPGRLFSMSTNTNGSPRAMVPIGMYEKIMPLDMVPTYLLRALIVGDTDQAQALGCLELDEEDLGLCTYVCTGKYDYGPLLRHNLTMIEKEG